MGVAGGPGVDGWRLGDAAEAGVSRLADLDRAVVEELRDDEADAGGDDRGGNAAARGQHRAEPSRRPSQCCAACPQPALAHGDDLEEARRQRAHTRTCPSDRPLRARVDEAMGPQQWRMSPFEAAIAGPVDTATPSGGPLRERRKDDGDASPRRCYHRPSLRKFFRSTLRRARLGPFFALNLVAPIPLSAGSLRFHPFPNFER
jgi:hypothetical protein